MGWLYTTCWVHAVDVVDQKHYVHVYSYDDLLVGAPLFSDILYDEGRVYVYMNKKKVMSDRFVVQSKGWLTALSSLYSFVLKKTMC